VDYDFILHLVFQQEAVMKRGVIVMEDQRIKLVTVERCHEMDHKFDRITCLSREHIDILQLVFSVFFAVRPRLKHPVAHSKKAHQKKRKRKEAVFVSSSNAVLSSSTAAPNIISPNLTATPEAVTSEHRLSFWCFCHAKEHPQPLCFIAPPPEASLHIYGRFQDPFFVKRDSKE
jgi:hypothetical protein